MTTLLLTLHVLVCIALIAIVLLQGGKGAEMGVSLGSGSSQTIFGATGGQSFMSKLTAGAAIIFMLTSLTLAYFYGQPGSSSVMPATVAPQSAPAPETPAAPVQEPAESAAPVQENN